MFHYDYVAKHYNLFPEDNPIIEITRPSETSGKYITYRRIVRGYPE